MIFLHKNVKSFNSILDLLLHSYSMNPIFVEKDYYVFLLLKLIFEKDNEIMFKGGTSLSKAWGIINRFSEDIDLNLRPEVPSTDSHRMKFNYAVYNAILDLGLSYDKSKMSSRREYNVFDFPINLRDSVGYIKDTMRIEAMANKKGKITNATYSNLRISNYIFDILSSSPQYYSLLINCGLEPFFMPVQNIDVTFVEKCMSLANRYLKGESNRVSRHLYDIHQMWYYGNLSTFNLNTCMAITKQHLLERNNDKCLRQDNRSAKSILIEALVSDFYEYDFETVTQSMKMKPNDGVTYQICKETLLRILGSMCDF